MSAASFLHPDLRKHGRHVPRLLLLGLCLLIVFAPRLDESAGVHAANLAFSATTQTYTLLALPPRGIDLQRPRISQLDGFRRTLLGHSPLLSAGAHHYSPLSHEAFAFRVNAPDGICRGSRLACLLLDLPPPSLAS